MWLQNLLFLSFVVCSLSAPTRSPITVTQPRKHVDAIKEALTLLKELKKTPAMLDKDDDVGIVSEEFSIQRPTCVQERLKVYEQGLRGNFTRLRGTLTLIAGHYKTYCPPTPENECETEVTTFSDFIDSLEGFLFDIPFDCWDPVQE